MKKVGFWQEYRGYSGYPSIKEDRGKGILYDESSQNILFFLEHGIKLIGTRGNVTSILTGEDIGNIWVFTDGNLLWTTELIHHFLQKNVGIPGDFLHEIKMKSFQMPSEEEIGREKLIEIEDSIINEIFY